MSSSVPADRPAPDADAAGGGGEPDGGVGVDGVGVDEGIRTLLLLVPRMVGIAKRAKVPEELDGLALAPRHLSLFAILLFEGPLTVNELAARLEVAPTTVSLMVGDLSRKGVLERTEDDADRRRTIVSLADAYRPAIDGWLSTSATAWRTALAPLSPPERRMFIDTLRTYEREIAASEAAKAAKAAGRGTSGRGRAPKAGRAAGG